MVYRCSRCESSHDLGLHEVDGGSKPDVYILDANVVIDYLEVDSSILSLAARHLGNLVVPRPVLFQEIDDLDEASAVALNLSVESPTDEEFGAAQGLPEGPLSLHDRISFAMARARCATCVTNEKPLRKLCLDEGVAVIRGLRLLILLVQRGELSSHSAIQVAEAIHAANPQYIHGGVLAEFKRILKKVRK